MVKSAKPAVEPETQGAPSSNPFVDGNGKSVADQGQPVNNGTPHATYNPCINPGIPVMSSDRMASLDIISLG